MLTSQEKRFYKITSLIKGTATLDELRALFLSWRSDEASTDFAQRVRAEGILANVVAARRGENYCNRRCGA